MHIPTVIIQKRPVVRFHLWTSEVHKWSAFWTCILPEPKTQLFLKSCVLGSAKRILLPTFSFMRVLGFKKSKQTHTNCRKLVTGLLVRDFLKPCSDGRPTLKVIIATSSKSPSISLNISQYLLTYAFTDSHSLIVIESKEFKGWRTLLHVMNREQNDWVNFLKELMEFVLSPSNHLIGIGLKLEGNTLHNKASSWEWTAIFCLN